MYQIKKEPYNVNEDLEKPPKHHDAALYVMDGFLSLNNFKKLVKKQGSQIYQNQCKNLEGS